MAGRELVAEVIAQVHRHGPVPFDRVMELALYDPVHGFYTVSGEAGRRGDFITSPEVGPLFGAVMGNALDAWWDALDRPDPFVVVEAGAGRGALAASISAAEPRCAGALTYALVERSERLRARHGEHLALSVPAHALSPQPRDDDEPSEAPGGGPRFVSLAELPALGFRGVVLANELLDNVPFRLAHWMGSEWSELRVGVDDGELVFVSVPITDDFAGVLDRLELVNLPIGSTIPVQTRAGEWVRSALSLLEAGRLVVIDYSSTTAAMAAREVSAWLRTYRAHGHGAGPLDDLGNQDITVEVAVDQLERVRVPDRRRDQATFLSDHGIAELVDEGRRIWHERAQIGDLEAIRGRSRVGEAEALLDASGLGAFEVLEWEIGARR